MPSRRLREPGHSLSWRALAVVALLSVPGMAGASPVGEEAWAQGAPLDPAQALFFGDPARELGLPRDLDALLATLAPRGARASAESAFDAYFAALGVAPTPEERARIEEALLTHPALFAALDPVLRDVAHAQRARDAAFASLTPDERARLVRAAVLLGSGDAGALDAEDAALVARLDLGRMESAAAALARDALVLDAALPPALRVDARVASALPPGAAEAVAARDALALLRALADREPPASSVEPLDVLLARDGVAPPLRVPPDLADALARVAGPVLRARATSGAADDRAALAAVADELPALVRASYNLSLRAPGDLDAFGDAPAPVEDMRRSGAAQPAVVLVDLLGPAAAPPTVPLAQGLAELRASLGLPADPSAAADLERRLGAELATALGTLLAAQARYQRDLAPDAPVPTLARARAEAVAPLVASGGPLAPGDLARLADAADAQAQLRALAGLRAGEVLGAVGGFQGLSVRTPVPLTGVVYRDASLVVLGPDANDVGPDVLPLTPVLLLDLGGDDRYTTPIAGVNATRMEAGVPVDSTVARTSVAIDLGGNDRYASTRPFAFGAARGMPFAPTLGLLADLSGNDVYAGNVSLGAGVDGIGILLDVAGDDRYDADAGLGLASAASGAMAAGILVDVVGTDAYRAQEGFARLRSGSVSPLAAAVFVDVAGPDGYAATCPEMGACFGTPREGEPSPTPGLIVFVDGGGKNEWPSGAQAGNSSTTLSTVVVNPFDPFNGTRRVMVVDGGPMSDSDGDLIFDALEPRLRQDPDRRATDDISVGDRDGDGWPDHVEATLGTDRDDGGSVPVGLPPPQGADPYGLLPNGGAGLPGRPSSRAFLVDVPGALAVGLPGTTTYTSSYGLILDLGLPSDHLRSANDRYFGNTSRDSLAIDLGGDDLYAPVSPESGPPRLLAHSTASPAVLLDLGGDDTYVVAREGLARSVLSADPDSVTLSLLLDADGNDAYLSPGGSAQAYADAGFAFLGDLDGDDTYFAPTQAISNTSGTAVFIDAAGDDNYTQTPSDINFTQWGDHQGVATRSGAGITTNANALFADLSGRDDYRLWNGDDLVDAPERNHRLRARPLDDPRGGAVAIFLDTSIARGTTVEDQDRDDAPDAAETAAGTSSRDRRDRPAQSPGFILDLPRLGIAIGSDADTTFRREYAFVLDTGGEDLYLNHAGASTPVFPTSLLLDHGGDADTYRSSGGTNLSRYLGRDTVAPSMGDASDATLGAAQGAGVFGVGVLVDGGGANRFDLTVETDQCAHCLPRAIALGVAQGAGLLGVGILEVHAGHEPSEFDVRAAANSTSTLTPGAVAVARAVAQGAGVVGIGILANQKEVGADVYRVEAVATGTNVTQASAAQGYSLRGLGVLLDGGGDNRFTAEALAQGAADDDDHTVPLNRGLTLPLWSSDHVVNRGRPTAALLLLPGVGSDQLVATGRAQAYAGAGGLAVLFDAEGDDNRTLLGAPTGLGGQGAAWLGAAYLVDDRGDDRYVAAVNGTQAFAFDGTAMLLDLSGSDVYEAWNQTQGAINSSDVNLLVFGTLQPHASVPAYALFLDRMGFDRYVIPTNATAQGSVAPPKRGPQGVGSFGAALFVDGGGLDRYHGRALGQAARRTPDGNNGNWNPTSGSYASFGVDDNSLGNAFSTVAARLYATAQSGAKLSLLAPGRAPWTLPTVNATVALRASIVMRDATNEPAGNQTIDRVEFHHDNSSLGTVTAPVAGGFEMWWSTHARDANQRPLYPDGLREMQSYIYPRAGTPKAGDPLHRRAAADVEPIPARLALRLDNPPLAQVPDVPRNLSVAWSPVTLPLWVDRDLERGECPLCAADAVVAPGRDEWDLPLLPPPGVPSRTCTDAACRPGLTVTSGGGQAHLNWTPPTQATGLLGYFVYRQSEEVETLLGYVDARAPGRIRDAAPPPDAKYAIAAHRADFSGDFVARSFNVSYVPDAKPGPIAGLRAVGAENATLLAWTAAAGADLYVVERSANGVAFTSLGTTAATNFTDHVAGGTALHDVSYHYRVTPWGPAGPSAVPAVAVNATAAPGALVSVWLDGPTNVTVLRDAPLGGGQVQRVAFDARNVPEGKYDLVVLVEDGGRRASRANATVVVDRAPPAVNVLIPGSVGASYIGPGGVRVPVTIEDVASGAKAVAAAARIDGGAWISLGEVQLSNLTFQDGAHLVNFVLGGVTDGQTAEIVAVAVDHAGNVGDLPPTPFAPTLADGLRGAQARGGTIVRFDFVPPVLRTTPLDLAVQPGTTVRLHALAEDLGTGLREVRARVGSNVLTLARHGTLEHALDWTPTEVGQHQVFFEAEDAAGNVAREAAGVVVVDDQPPLVLDAAVRFPGGRLVGTPGETARIVVHAVDDGTALDGLFILVDASEVSSRGILRLPWSRTDQAYAADVVVDRVAAFSENEVAILLQDRAGNQEVITLPVRIDSIPVDFATAPTLDVAADRAWLNWTSVEPARARVDVGTGPQLGTKGETGPAGTEHRIVVTGLKPATRYFAKAILVTDAGIETTSPLLEFTTTPGLVVTLAPQAGLPWTRGEGRLQLEVRTYDGRPADATAEVFLLPPRGSPARVADAPGDAAFDIDLRSFRDGAYKLVARAKSGDLGGQSAPLDVTLDRTPPIVDLATEALIVPQRPLVVTAMERGSGIDVANVSITVDGAPCVASLVGDALTCLAPDVAGATAELRVNVTDRAGNTGSFHARLPAAPREGAVLRSALLVGETGTDALRPGGSARLLVSSDAVGIRRVVADLRALGGAEEQEIPRTSSGEYQLALTVPPRAASGPVVIPIAAVDRADHARHLMASGVVDGAPPRAQEVDVLLGESPGSVVVRVVANEPVRLRVDAPGAHAERKDHRVDTQVALSGLRPGRAFQAVVTLEDRAGNVATLTADGESPPDRVAPGPVSDLRAVDLGDGRIVLLWSPASDDVGVDAYRIYRRADGALRLLAESAQPRFEHDGAPDEDVEFVVAALDVGGNEGDGVFVSARSVAVPRLVDGRVDPPVGGPGVYEFRVNVTQRAGAPPVVEVVVDGRPVRMTTDASDCRAGCAYRALVTLGPQAFEGDGHQYSFVAHHERLGVRLPEGGQTFDGPVVVGSAPSSFLQGASRVPLTPMLGLAAVAVAAAGVVAWRILRRKSQ